jgi:hypothetical protein
VQVVLGEVPADLVDEVLEGGAVLGQPSLQSARMYVQVS